MEAAFHFVDGAQLGREERRRLRSHVMKGKNAGKKLHRTSRVKAQLQPREQRIVSHKPRVAAVASRPYFPSPSPPRMAANLFLSVAFPFELSPQSLRIINQYFFYVVEKLYPAQFGLSPEEAKSGWLRVLLQDAAACHCAVSLMQACNELFIGEGADSKAALFHTSRTFELVGKRLCTKEALADSTLAIVLMIVVQEQIRSQIEDADIHFEGLRRMVALRGGMENLESNRALVLKICKTDITFALWHGGPLDFYRDRMGAAKAALKSNGYDLDMVAIDSAMFTFAIDLRIQKLLRDCVALSSFLNSNPGDGKLQLRVFEEILVSICSRLIQFRALKSDHEPETTDAVCQVGLLLFVMTLFLQHNHKRISTFALVTQRLTEVVQNAEQVDDDLALWALLMGGIWGRHDPGAAWIRSKIKVLSDSMGIRDWEEASRHIAKFPWVDSVHQRPGRTVWEVAIWEHHSVEI